MHQRQMNLGERIGILCRLLSPSRLKTGAGVAREPKLVLLNEHYGEEKGARGGGRHHQPER